MANTNNHVKELLEFEVTLNQAERIEELETLLASNSDCDSFLDYCEEYDDLITMLEVDESLDH